MNKVFHTSILLISLWSSLSALTIGGKRLILFTESTVTDTLEWESIINTWEINDSITSLAKHPRQVISELDSHNKRVFKLQNCTALSLAILIDLQYDVALLTQWNCHPSTPLERSDDKNKSGHQRFVTDFLWEQISMYDIKKPDALRDDFLLTLTYKNGGKSTFEGKATIDGSFESISLGSQSSSIRYANGGSEELKPQRKIHEVWMVVDNKVKPSRLISHSESKMDVLKLDLSYKPPEIIEIKK